MDKLKYITKKMRVTLFDWIINTASDLSMKISTCHIAFNLIDRFMQKNPKVAVTKYQLVGLVGLMIACKVEVFLLIF